VTTLGWLSIALPVVTLGVGGIVGWFSGRLHDAQKIAELEAMAVLRGIEIEALRKAVAVLSSADMSDNEFNKLLNDVAEA